MMRNGDEVKKVATSSKSRKKTAGAVDLNLLQWPLALLGSGIAIFYLQSGKTCAAEPECGWGVSETYPFLNIPSDIYQYILFAGGAIEITLMNGYLAFKAVPQLTKYLKKQATATKKALAFAGQALFAGSQAYEKVLVLNGVGGVPAWHKFLAASAAVPGALFSGVNMANHELPRLFSKSQEWRMRYLADRKQHNKKWLDHYAREHDALLNRVETNLRKAFANISLIQNKSAVGDAQQLLKELAQKTDDDSLPPWRKSRCHDVASWVGRCGVSVIIGLVMLNLQDELSEHKGFSARVFFETLFFGASAAYTTNKILVGETRSMFHGIWSVAHDRAIPSVAYQLYTRKTLIAWMVGFLIATQSYSTLFMLEHNKYPDDWPFKYAIGKAAIVAVTFAHFFGANHLWDIFLKNLSATDTERVFFEMVELYEELGQKTTLQFIQWVKDKEALYQVDKYADYDDLESQKPVKTDNTVVKPKSCWQKAWTLFGWGNTQSKDAMAQAIKKSPRYGSTD